MLTFPLIKFTCSDNHREQTPEGCEQNQSDSRCNIHLDQVSATDFNSPEDLTGYSRLPHLFPQNYCVVFLYAENQLWKFHYIGGYVSVVDKVTISISLHLFSQRYCRGTLKSKSSLAMLDQGIAINM